MKLENNCEKLGILEAERLSNGQLITDLTNLKAALTLKEVEIMKIAPGIVHDHM